MPPRSSPTPAAPCRRRWWATIPRPASACCARIEPPKIKPIAFGKSADVKEQDPELVASGRRHRHGAAGACGKPPRVRRKLGVPDRGRDLHQPAASGMERGGADQPRRQAGRRRLARRRRRQRRGRGQSRQHVRADRSAGADHGGPSGQGARRRARLTPGSASTPRRRTAGCSSAASRRAGPAEKSGLKRGDIIVGVGGERTRTLSDFYRKVWARGDAGVTVPLDVLSGGEPRRVEVQSVNRLDTLKLKSTF